MKPHVLKGKTIFTAMCIAVILFAIVGIGLRSRSRNSINEALLEAVRSGNASLVHTLLSNGANPNVRLKPPSVWSGPLSDEEAAEERSREPTLLMIAAMQGNKAVVQVLLSGGADPNAKDKMGSTVIDWAGAYPEIVELLKKHQK